MKKLTDTIYLVPGKNNGRFPYCHCIYIQDEVNVLIDSAAGDAALFPLYERVDVLINTHYHPDHIRGNMMFPRAEIYCHAADREPLTDYDQWLRYTGFRAFTSEQIKIVLQLLDYRPSRCHKTIRDNEVLDFGRTKLRVVHTPGHSPGHCCFMDERTGLFIGGDIDLTAFGPWYAHQSSSLPDFMESMERVISYTPSLYVSSHGEDLFANNLAQRLDDYNVVFSVRNEAVLSALREPLALDELVGKHIIYPRHPDPGFLYFFFERMMLQKHLDLLAARGMVRYEEGRYRLQR